MKELRDVCMLIKRFALLVLSSDELFFKTKYAISDFDFFPACSHTSYLGPSVSVHLRWVLSLSSPAAQLRPVNSPYIILRLAAKLIFHALSSDSCNVLQFIFKLCVQMMCDSHPACQRVFFSILLATLQCYFLVIPDDK